MSLHSATVLALGESQDKWRNGVGDLGKGAYFPLRPETAKQILESPGRSLSPLRPLLGVFTTDLLLETEMGHVAQFSFKRSDKGLVWKGR